MSNQTIEAKIATFGALLSENFIFKAPIFQRPYVWPKSKVTKLLEDVQESGEDIRDGHFVGAMFVSRKVNASPMAPGEYWVIDGQQRMTTIFVTVLALHVLIDEQSRKLGRNRDQTEDIIQEKVKLDSLSFNLRKHLLIEPRAHEFELKFTSTLKDLPQLCSLILKLNEKREEADKLNIKVPVPPSVDGSDKTEISDAYSAARSALLAYLGIEYTAEKVTALVTKILGYTKVVFITLTDSDDACEVFDTLNSTQERLKVVDLVRNEVFLRVKDDVNYVKAQRVYDFGWKPFDDKFDGQRHLDDYFFPYSLVKNPNVKKSKLNRFLSDLWDEGTPLTPEQIIKDLTEWSPIYLALSSENSVNIERLKERLKPVAFSALWKLRRMNCPSSAYPYLMQLGKECLDSEDTTKSENFAKCVGVIESFLVRRFFCGYEPTGLHAVFKDMWAVAKDDSQVLRNSLLAVTTIVFPENNELESAIAGRPMYRGSLTSYVLMEYERFLANSAEPYPDNYEEDNKMHIDHIMPQSAEESWRAAFPDFEKVLHTLPNLVIMGAVTNQRKSDKTWPETQTFFTQGSRILSVNEVLNIPSWNTQEMTNRATRLKRWASERWPR